MARGTTFGSLHSHRDLGLIQQSVDLQPARPKLNIIDVPGADGSKDLSAHPAGRVVFNDREITWTFALYPGDKWHDKHRQVSNALNGLACHIVLDDDPNYYYDGRLSVDKYNINGLLRQIVIRAVCRPYKLHRQITGAYAELTTSYKTLDLYNDRKPAVPTIEITAETTLAWGDHVVTLSAGKHKLLDLELLEGKTELQAKVTSGTGTITLTYQKGAL